MRGNAFRAASQAFFSCVVPLVSVTEFMVDPRSNFLPRCLRPGNQAHLSMTRKASPETASCGDSASLCRHPPGRVVNTAQLLTSLAGPRQYPRKVTVWRRNRYVHFYTLHRNKSPVSTILVGELGDKALEDSIVILVVEDDPLIRTVVEETLDGGGFEPAIAVSGEEAITLLRNHNGKYRALVTDINLLGRIDGWEIAKQARELDPAFPIVYMTGAAAEQYASHGVPNSVLLTKPFAPAQLITALSNLLNNNSPTT
jgi:CheY-like chemotaxis protein